MKRFIATVFLVCFTLELTLAGDSRWEVINNGRKDDDQVSQQEIFYREELIPLRSPKSKLRRLLQRKETGKATEEARDLRGGQKLQRGAPFGEEGLLPLRVPHTNLRHLLHVYPAQGPKLTAEIQRLREKLGLKDNLSTPCKDEVDDDCLFEIDDYVSQKMSANAMEKEDQDLNFNERKLAVTATVSQEDDGPLSRHKRQANNNNNNNNNNNSDDDGNSDGDDSSDNTDEGSGTSSSSEELYSPQSVHSNEGLYTVDRSIGFQFNQDSITDEDKQKYQKELQKKLDKIFKDLPGYQGVKVNEPTLQNGVLIFNFTIVIDGSEADASAQQMGQTNLKGYIFGDLTKAMQPLMNGIILFGSPVSDDHQVAGFVDELRIVLDDYCNSVSPCPNVGPEFDTSACVNTGLMSGFCRHKCADFPCQNKAACQLNKNHKPYCNCGKRYTGEFCQEKKQRKKRLTKGETVGVGVAGTLAALACLSCCLYLMICRRRPGNVDFSYYEDEGSQDNLSDPTSPSSYFIRRPQIKGSAISVFKPPSDEDV